MSRSSARTEAARQPSSSDAVAGDFKLGHGVEVGYFSQHGLELDERGSVLDCVQRMTGLNRPQAQTLLGRFLFSGWDAHMKQVRDLSGGERRRLGLAILVTSGANLLVLDEPTNHLDLDSRETLEAALEGFPGTVLLVSHDRALLDAVAQRTAAIEDGTVRVYDGGWADLVRAREEREEPKPERDAQGGAQAGGRRGAEARPRPAGRNRSGDRAGGARRWPSSSRSSPTTGRTPRRSPRTRRARAELQAAVRPLGALLEGGRGALSRSARRLKRGGRRCRPPLGMTATRDSRLSRRPRGARRSTSARTGTSRHDEARLAKHRDRHRRPRRRHRVPRDARQPDGGLRARRVGRLHARRQADRRGASSPARPAGRSGASSTARSPASPAWRSPASARSRSRRPRSPSTSSRTRPGTWRACATRRSTQCYALQTNADTAMRAWARRGEDAAAIAVYIVREVQPVLPPDYRSTRLLRRRPARPATARASWP